MSEETELLSTHDLKGRGWTPALIRDFLGPHDATRPNLMRFGRRRNLAPVKLYLAERVNEAESSEEFLVAQGRAMEARERAERAGKTRRANRARQVEAFVSSWQPQIVPVQIRRGASRKAYKAHQEMLRDAQERAAQHVKGLSRQEMNALLEPLRAKYKVALEGAYPWLAKE